MLRPASEVPLPLPPSDQHSRGGTASGVWPPRSLAIDQDGVSRWRGYEVQGVWHQPNGKILGYVIRGWPSTIPARARMEMPPKPRSAVYGPAARRAARDLLAREKRLRKSGGRAMGAWTRASLRRVVQGLRPLEFYEWRRAVRWLEQAEERCHWGLRRPTKKDAGPTLRFTLVSGGPPLLSWH
jgi:hypothetical protein